MEMRWYWHPFIKPLYAKHQVAHVRKVGEGFFPDVVLGSGCRPEPASYP